MKPQIPPHTHTHTHTHTHCCSHHHHPQFPHFHLPHFLLFHHHHHRHFCRLLPTGSSSLPLNNPCQSSLRPEDNGDLGVSRGQQEVLTSLATGLEHEDGAQDTMQPEEEEEEDEDDAVFVMTDEWKEFFAKSEAKRRLEKQQKRKGEKQANHQLAG